MDTVVEPILGKRLLQLCIDQGLVILNGRLPGDVGGAYTFHAWRDSIGREATSLVDYFVASPSITFDNYGNPKQGASLNVAASTPLAPGGEKFDHRHVTLTFDIEKKMSAIERKPQPPARESYMWHHQKREEYARTLRDISEVQELLA